MSSHLIRKLLSARFWMALILVSGFVWGFHTKLIAGEAFTAVVLVVVRDYFARSDRHENEEGEK